MRKHTRMRASSPLKRHNVGLFLRRRPKLRHIEIKAAITCHRDGFTATIRHRGADPHLIPRPDRSSDRIDILLGRRERQVAVSPRRI